MVDDHSHFNGTYEVEQKFRVADLAAFRARLLAAGAADYLIGNHEIDLYLDTPEKAMAANGLTLVLRNMQPIDRTLWIIKGPTPDACIATRLPDFAKAKQMLTLMNYAPYLTIEKHRDIYFFGALHITLDVLASLGSFVEIAVMSDDKQALPGLATDVTRAARQLGLAESDLVTQSYRQMIEAL